MTAEQLEEQISTIISRLAREELSPLAIALELLSLESSTYLLVMRLGDHDPTKPADAPRAFAVAGEGMTDDRLVKTVGDWYTENRPTPSALGEITEAELHTLVAPIADAKNAEDFAKAFARYARSCVEREIDPYTKMGLFVGAMLQGVAKRVAEMPKA